MTRTLTESLNALTVDQLKQLMRYVTDRKGITRKSEMIKQVIDCLLDDHGDELKVQYDQLDEWEKLAIAEALYSKRGFFSRDLFRLKYKRLPGFYAEQGPARFDTSRKLSRLRLFLYDSVLPSDLIPLLRNFVHKPAAVCLTTMKQLPEVKTEELQIRLCEREALIDLPVVCNLVQQGKLKVSSKTNRPSAATVDLLANSLDGGDFYDSSDAERLTGFQEIGGIKAFAWPLLLQAGKLTQVIGNKLEYTKNGTRQLAKPTAETLRNIWQKWHKTTLLDEFRRVEAIKGQSAKGRLMTAVAPRRAALQGALQECPVGEWVAVDEFMTYMQLTGHNFEVAYDLWKLYLVDREYGSLGYSGFGEWSIVQGRYVLCLLFEYAATLGMLDVAFTDPQYARDDFRGNWGAEDLAFLSRYDGLRYFRLTELGAYCLGLCTKYEAPVIESDCRFAVLPNLHINLIAGTPSAEDRLQLDTWTSAVAEDSWKLDKPKAILAIERGHDIDSLADFLAGKDEQLLPERVESFIGACRKQAVALRQVAVTLLLECSTEDIASTLAKHRETQKLCQRIGKKQLLIKQAHEEKFRQAARIVGFGMAL